MEKVKCMIHVYIGEGSDEEHELNCSVLEFPHRVPNIGEEIHFQMGYYTVKRVIWFPGYDDENIPALLYVDRTGID